MRVIWKYDVSVGAFALTMPAGAKILSVDTQGMHPKFWALVNTEAELVRRKFVTVATGENVSDDIEKFVFVGTFSVQMGLIFHLFDAGEE